MTVACQEKFSAPPPRQLLYYVVKYTRNVWYYQNGGHTMHHRAARADSGCIYDEHIKQQLAMDGAGSRQRLASETA